MEEEDALAELLLLLVSDWSLSWLEMLGTALGRCASTVADGLL